MFWSERNARDEIDGGSGNDNIDSRGGNDTIEGGAGNDHIVAGSGNDLVRAGEGNDIVFGGLGDGLDFRRRRVTIGCLAAMAMTPSSAMAEMMFCMARRATICLFGGTGDDLAFGGAGRDVL